MSSPSQAQTHLSPQTGGPLSHLYFDEEEAVRQQEDVVPKINDISEKRAEDDFILNLKNWTGWIICLLFLFAVAGAVIVGATYAGGVWHDGPASTTDTGTVSPTVPTIAPVPVPTTAPIKTPSSSPTLPIPTASPTLPIPTASPTLPIPTASPTTKQPSSFPTSSRPSASPSSSRPSRSPSRSPSTSRPSRQPSTSRPTKSPIKSPTSLVPSLSPSTSRPSRSPTRSPSSSRPSRQPTVSAPSQGPTTSRPSRSPSKTPSTSRPSRQPTFSTPTNSPALATATSAPVSCAPIVVSFSTVASTCQKPYTVNSDLQITWTTSTTCSGIFSVDGLELPSPSQFVEFVFSQDVSNVSYSVVQVASGNICQSNGGKKFYRGEEAYNQVGTLIYSSTSACNGDCVTVGGEGCAVSSGGLRKLRLFRETGASNVAAASIHISSIAYTPTTC